MFIILNLISCNLLATFLINFFMLFIVLYSYTLSQNVCCMCIFLIIYNFGYKLFCNFYCFIDKLKKGFVILKKIKIIK